jgi:hypothetical protein
MLKNKFVNISFILALVLALVLSVAGVVLAAGSGPVPAPPTLKLTVEQSPLTVYPPFMIYTAQLSYVPTNSSTQLTVDFYNLTASGTTMEYLGSAPVDKTGKAVLSKQMKAGSYTAIASIVINTQTIVSNKVTYKVP